MNLIGKTCELTAEDLLVAMTVTGLQLARKVHAQRNRDHGQKSERRMRERLGDGVSGTLGELALSRLLDRAWTAGGVDIKDGDVGGTLEARTTDWADGHLIVYDRDDDEHVFCLLTGSYPLLRVAGFIRGSDAKRREWFREGKDPPSYWVPQSALVELAVIPLHVAGMAA